MLLRRADFSRLSPLRQKCERLVATACTLTAPPRERSLQYQEGTSVAQGRRKSPLRHVIYAAFSVTKLPHGAMSSWALAIVGVTRIELRRAAARDSGTDLLPLARHPSPGRTDRSSSSSHTQKPFDRSRLHTGSPQRSVEARGASPLSVARQFACARSFRRLRRLPREYLEPQSEAFAAFSMSSATSFGCDRKTAWLPGSSMVLDLALLVMKRSRSGLIIRSCMATTA